MANPDRPNGFRPVKSLNGSPWNALVRRYEIADNSALTGGTPDHGNVAIGDVVKLSSGKVVPAVTNDSMLGVVVAVGGGDGVIEHGTSGPFLANQLEKQYVTAAESASGTWYAWVAPARDTVFECQTNADLDLLPGSNADISVADTNTAHMSLTTGMSTTELATSSNADVVVIENPEYPDNDMTLTNARHWVKFTDVAF